MRAWPTVIVLCILLVAPASAQTIVTSVAVDRTELLPLLEAVRETAGNSVDLDDCFGGTWTEASGGIDFSEGAEEQGCGTARLELDVPVGTQDITVSFAATRRVVFDGPDQLTVAARMQQDIIVASGPHVGQQALWPLDHGPQTTPQDKTFTFPVSAGAPTSITWLFADRGGPVSVLGSPVPSGQEFGGLIENATVQFRGAGDVDPTQQVIESLEAEGLNVTRHLVTVPIVAPPGGSIQGARITARAEYTIIGFEGPAGTVPIESLPRVETGDTVTLTLSEALLAQHGQGAYNLTFESSQALPPAPNVVPVTLPWLFWVAFGVPALAGVLATASASRFMRAAEGRYRPLAWGVGTLIVALLLYHLVVWSIAARQPRLPFVEPPIEGLPLVLYLQSALLFLVFLALAFWAGRSLMRSMQHDLEERRVQEIELRRSNEELERFAYVASHDLQEPLRKIAGATQMLERRYSDQLGDDARKWIGYSVGGAKRMQALIHGLLDYSRADRVAHDLQEVDVSKIVAEALEDLGARVEEEQATVEVGDLPPVRCDATQVRQVFQNLIGNALKYRDPGRPPVVHVSGRRERDRVVFEVADNGIGIPDKDRAEVFQIFRRLHSRDVYEGTGIGLALAQKVVNRHDGQIRVESNEPHGSVFLFDLEAV